MDVDQNWTIWVWLEGGQGWHSFMFGTYDRLRDRLILLWKETKARAKLYAPDGTLHGFVRLPFSDINGDLTATLIR